MFWIKVAEAGSRLGCETKEDKIINTSDLVAEAGSRLGCETIMPPSLTDSGNAVAEAGSRLGCETAARSVMRFLSAMLQRQVAV